MRKDYESPKAEKLNFNYQENVVASGGWKKGKDNPGCYQANNSAENDCIHYEDQPPLSNGGN